MFKIIFFAVKIVLAALLVIPLFLSRYSPVSRDKIGVYSLVSVVSATVIVISSRMDSSLVAASLFIAVGIVSVTQFNKGDPWIEALRAVAPFWLVAIIGMCVGAGMLIQAVILVAISYYIINYVPTLLKRGGGKPGSTE